MNKIDTKCSICKFNKLCKYTQEMNDRKESLNAWILNQDQNEPESPIWIDLKCNYYEKREAATVRTNINLSQTRKMTSDSIDKMEDTITW